MKDGFRDAHGASRHNDGRVTASECPPVDELRPAKGVSADQAERGADGRFRPGNRLGARKTVRAGKRGAIFVLTKQGDAAARAAVEFGRRYASHRRSELAAQHGAISAGVGAIIESAGELLAGARYWGARGMAEGNADFAKLAGSLLSQHRGCERDAWQLAALEAAARPRRRGRTETDEISAGILARSKGSE